MRISDWSSDVCSSDLSTSAPESRRHPTASRPAPPPPLWRAQPERDADPAILLQIVARMVGRRLIALLHLAGQVDAVEADREERREIVRDARVELAIGPPEDRDGAGAVAVDRIEIVVAPVPRQIGRAHV